MKYTSECRADDPAADTSTDNALGQDARESGFTGAAGWGWSTPVGAEQEARRIFQRTLSAWAMDVLELRRLGMDSPGYRSGESRLVVPA